jgi:hypothetical protein
MRCGEESRGCGKPGEWGREEIPTCRQCRAFLLTQPEALALLLDPLRLLA